MNNNALLIILIILFFGILSVMLTIGATDFDPQSLLSNISNEASASNTDIDEYDSASAR